MDDVLVRLRQMGTAVYTDQDRQTLADAIREITALRTCKKILTTVADVICDGDENVVIAARRLKTMR